MKIELTKKIAIAMLQSCDQFNLLPSVKADLTLEEKGQTYWKHETCSEWRLYDTKEIFSMCIACGFFKYNPESIIVGDKYLATNGVYYVVTYAKHGDVCLVSEEVVDQLNDDHKSTFAEYKKYLESVINTKNEEVCIFKSNAYIEDDLNDSKLTFIYDEF